MAYSRKGLNSFYPHQVWTFYFLNGTQTFAAESDINGGWAVRDGDVAVIPLPAGIWLLGSGLLGLAGLRRGGRRR